MKIYSLTLAGIALLALPIESEAADSTAKKTKTESKSAKKLVLNTCKAKVVGDYKFGEAGTACTVETYDNKANALSRYQNYIFDERQSESAERKDYVTHLYKLLNDSAQGYYKQRKPKATKEEVATFQRGMLALAHQESFWSHYRIAKKDSDLKVMKGDQNHSFGLVQLHSKWHRKMVIESKAWSLPGNIAYGMDLYYQAWQKAGKEKCVKTLENRARAAYSIYNAGAKKGCRWKNPKGDKYAHNDKNYYSKFKGQEWNSHLDKGKLAQLGKPALVNCVLDNGGICK